MKICVVQTRPTKGDIQANLGGHNKLISLAVSRQADLVIFPELSLTGYEPQLAEKLATDQNDSRLDTFQEIADEKGITLGVGMPTRSAAGVHISMVLFQPQLPRQTYSKQYVHADEEPFFVGGHSSVSLAGDRAKVALAICYELSVPEHSESAARRGTEIYIASVAKTATGVEKATETLSQIAQRHSMTVFMANCLGMCGGMECAGRSAVWNSHGEMLGQLDDSCEGILVLDTETQELIEETI